MKLEIEVIGRMHQDWDNEVFSWDGDNLIKITVADKLIVSKYFKEFTISEEESDIDNGLYKTGIMPDYYLIDYWEKPHELDTILKLNIVFLNQKKSK